METWKPIKNNENYVVSNKGDIKRIFKNGERTLKHRKEWADKPPHVSLSKGGKQNVISVDRLVYTNFTPDWDFDRSMKSFRVYHKDNNIDNCCYDNLYIKHHKNIGRSKRETGMIADWINTVPYASFVWSNGGTGSKYIRFIKQGKNAHDKIYRYNDEIDLLDVKEIYKD